MRVAWLALLPPLLLAGGAQAAPAAACDPDSGLTIAQGAVCGAVSAVSDRVFVYKGLPYAKPPVPAAGLRWMPPQPPSGWDGQRPALAFGPICPQYASGTLQGAEDCLYLNVWTPRTAAGDGISCRCWCSCTATASPRGRGRWPLDGAALAPGTGWW